MAAMVFLLGLKLCVRSRKRIFLFKDWLGGWLITPFSRKEMGSRKVTSSKTDESRLGT